MVAEADEEPCRAATSRGARAPPRRPPTALAMGRLGQPVMTGTALRGDTQKTSRPWRHRVFGLW